MTKHVNLLVIMLIAFVGNGSSAQSQTLTAAQWNQDLEYVVESIRDHHPNPFHLVSEDSFLAQVDQLQLEIPELEDHEIVVELSVLVASLQDGHTGIRGGFQFLTGQYPIQFDSYADGIFVKSAPDAISGIIGSRLLTIGNVSAEEVFSRISTMTARDNTMTLKNRVPASMVIPEILHALDITPERDRARFVFVDSSEREFILDLNPIPFEQQLNWKLEPAAELQPMYMQASATNYRHEYLAGSESLYVQYNQVRNAPNESIADYFGRLAEFVEQNPTRRIILDVRLNGGGNDYLNSPVLEWVQSSLPRVDGNFYVIIGRGTYSAAQKLVTRLEQTTDVIFVGESTGGSPNHFGDAITTSLPNSDLTLTVSSIYHNDAPGDVRLSIDPDIDAVLTYADYREGRDPALQAILSIAE